MSEVEKTVCWPHGLKQLTEQIRLLGSKLDCLAAQLTTPSVPPSLDLPSFSSKLKTHTDLRAQERKTAATAPRARAPASVTEASKPAETPVPLCGDFASKRGCTRGSCKYLHEVPECKDFKRGKCARGANCRFVHKTRAQTQPQSQAQRQPPPPPQLQPPGTHTELISRTAFASAPTSGLAHPSLATPAAVAQPAAPAAMACADKHASSDSGAPSPSRRGSSTKRFRLKADLEEGELSGNDLGHNSPVPKRACTSAEPVPAAALPAAEPAAKPADAATASNNDSVILDVDAPAAWPTPPDPAAKPVAADSSSTLATTQCLWKCGFSSNSTDDMCRHTNAAHGDLLPADTDLHGMARFVNEVMAEMRCFDGHSARFCDRCRTFFADDNSAVARHASACEGSSTHLSRTGVDPRSGTFRGCLAPAAEGLIVEEVLLSTTELEAATVFALPGHPALVREEMGSVVELNGKTETQFCFPLSVLRSHPVGVSAAASLPPGCSSAARLEALRTALSAHAVGLRSGLIERANAIAEQVRGQSFDFATPGCGADVEMLQACAMLVCPLITVHQLEPGRFFATRMSYPARPATAESPTERCAIRMCHNLYTKSCRQIIKFWIQKKIHFFIILFLIW